MDIQMEDFDTDAEFAALMADLFAEDYHTDTDGWDRY